MTNQNLKSKILILLLLLSAILVWTAVIYKPTPLLRATFLDVGQGDSVFLQFPHGGNMLIDGGRFDMGRRIVAYLRRQGVRRIDILLLTHPHDDHVGGVDCCPQEFSGRPGPGQRAGSRFLLLRGISKTD
ncbi:MBL fold metallo-hydrolase, partial [candidate division NPL-UPA2 bacterium]|nr:MBL fold metallo-hydrolase [candidate division NPL-UPA2 bacterium]